MLGKSALSIGSLVHSQARRLFSTSGARFCQGGSAAAPNEADLEQLFSQQDQQQQGGGGGNQPDQQQFMQQAQQQYGDSQRAFREQGAPQRRYVNRGINRVELLGGVAGVPAVKVTSQGVAFASFNLYTNVDRKMFNGQTITSTEVHNVIAFGGMARYIEKTITKGQRVYLTGRLHYTGGQLMADGSRTPRICSINLESLFPLAKSGGAMNAGGGEMGGHA